MSTPLGLYDLGPSSRWQELHGKSSNVQYTFIDPQARWIWSHSNAATYSTQDHVPGQPWKPDPLLNHEFHFFTTVDVPDETNVTFHIMVDNFAKIELNGVEVGCPQGVDMSPKCENNKFYAGFQKDHNYPKIPMTLRKGLNEILVKAVNDGGPGGFIGSIIKTDGTVLRRTNATDWVYQDPKFGTNPPASSPPSDESQSPENPTPNPVEVIPSTGLFGLSTTTLLIIGAGIVFLCIMLAFGSMILMR